MNTLTASLRSFADNAPAAGKYAGYSPEQIAEMDPAYLCWAFEHIPGFCSQELYDATRQDMDDEPSEWYWPWGE